MISPNLSLAQSELWRVLVCLKTPKTNAVNQIMG
jgi:hypothetical protein